MNRIRSRKNLCAVALAAFIGIVASDAAAQHGRQLQAKQNYAAAQESERAPDCSTDTFTYKDMEKGKNIERKIQRTKGKCGDQMYLRISLMERPLSARLLACDPKQTAKGPLVQFRKEGQKRLNTARLGEGCYIVRFHSRTDKPGKYTISGDLFY